MTKLNHVSTASLLFTALVGLTLGACTLEPKMIGAETEGGEDCKNGDVMPAEDDCNDCTCVDGAWACTEKACGETGPSPVCEEGETKLADDGCNDCICAGGGWACTKMACPPAECEPGTTKMEDCNTCDCYEGGWVCTDLACGEAVCGDGVLDEDEQCDDGNTIDDDECTNTCTLGQLACGPKDPLEIGSATIAADTLNVEVSYGGGCETHLIGMCWDGIFAESFPVQAWVSLSHNGNGDACEAWITEMRQIDLSAMKTAYQEGYQTKNGTIVIHLEGWPNAIDYTF